MYKPKFVKQPTPRTCGHSVIAMLLAVSVDSLVAFIGDKIITDKEMLNIVYELRYKGLSTGKFLQQEPDDLIIAIQKHENPDNPKMGHWTLSWYGETLDPAEIGDSLWPVVRCIPVFSCVQEIED